MEQTLALTARAFDEAAARGLLAPRVAPESAAASLIGLLAGFGYLSVSLRGGIALDSAAALAQFFDLVSAEPLSTSADEFCDHAAA